MSWDYEVLTPDARLLDDQEAIETLIRWLDQHSVDVDDVLLSRDGSVVPSRPARRVTYVSLAARHDLAWVQLEGPPLPFPPALQRWVTIRG